MLGFVGMKAYKPRTAESHKREAGRDITRSRSPTMQDQLDTDCCTAGLTWSKSVVRTPPAPTCPLALPSPFSDPLVTRWQRPMEHRLRAAVHKNTASLQCIQIKETKENKKRPVMY